MSRLILYSFSSQETQSIGEKIGRCLVSGQVMALCGDLGAGKTCLVQGIARGLQVLDRYIPSPTFTIMNEYQGRLPLYHFDVYRLVGPEEMEALGYEEFFYGEGVTVIEWAEKIAPLLPQDHLRVFLFSHSPKIRKLSFESYGEKSGNLLGLFRYLSFRPKSS